MSPGTQHYLDEIREAKDDKAKISKLVQTAFHDRYVRKSRPDIDFSILGELVRELFDQKLVKEICKTVALYYNYHPAQQKTSFTWIYTYYGGGTGNSTTSGNW